MDSVNGARIAWNPAPNASALSVAHAAAAGSGGVAGVRAAPASVKPGGTAAAPSPASPTSSTDSAEISAGASAIADLPEDFKASPDLMAAYKAAEEARTAMLAEGRVPTMSSIDAARIIALLS
ncbi:MAG: hypothetical protein LW650_08610 [Planctomycetaceae bacterium]|jgi:hypothetical protein|nr:hypothetical protein [Phycisphaerales bacterium]MCE2653541.1 hypothetical protein [Planctomycetaceae bacterium]